MSDFTLKTDPAVFQDVLDGKKTFEIRFNDRGYQVGDLIVLKETKFTGQQMREGSPLIYTGREMQKQISYILSGYGLQDGWVILGITDFDHQQAKIEKLENELSTTKQVLGNVIDMEVAKVDNLKAQLNNMETCYIQFKQINNEQAEIIRGHFSARQEMKKCIDAALYDIAQAKDGFYGYSSDGGDVDNLTKNIEKSLRGER